MELWIRSQDKAKLEQVYNLYVLELSDEKYVIENNDSHLGEYKTEERALEVLDEIQNVLKPIIVFKNAEINKETWEEIQKVGVCAINDRADVIKLDTFVYEMPKE